MKQKVLLITPGGLPVPSVKGGAVQNIIEHFIFENNKNNKIDLEVVAPFDSKAIEVARKEYPNTKFSFVKIPKIALALDLICYHIIKALFKDVKAISFKNNFKMGAYVFKIAKKLKRNEYDKVILENNIRLFWAIKLFNNKNKYSQRIYYHLHNIPRTTGGCSKEIASCRRIICVSDFVKHNICSNKSKIGKIDLKKAIVLHNCIDTNRFNNEEKSDMLKTYQKKYSIKKEDVVIVFAGRLSPEKGALETIKAISKIPYNNVKLLIVGSDFYGMKTVSPYEKMIKQEAMNQKERIVFTGYVDYSKMPIIYHLGTIAVFPSIWDEPAGLTTIEAMACGIPVITTESGGIPEYVDKSAIILKRDDNLVDNIAANIELLLSDDLLREKLAVQARKTAIKYNKEKYYESFLKSVECE